MAINNATILDGKGLAARLRGEMAGEVNLGLSRGWRSPGLAVILVGDNAASQIYVANKQKACADVGIQSFPFILPAHTSQGELLALIETLNQREDVDGILLQLPLPNHLDAEACIEAISPAKDVDGFHPINVGRLTLGLPGFAPCTPAGVMEILKHYGFSLNGKKAVVVGRSNIVGKPLALLLANRDNNATVTVCHSRTPNLADECRKADFLFVAVGRPGAITADMVKPGCVVIDIGINREAKRLTGDVAYDEVAAKAAAITPVPGGVGPMTIAMLLRNTLQAWRKACSRRQVGE